MNKHLGLTTSLQGDTSLGCKKISENDIKRVKEIKLAEMEAEPQKYSVNSLIVTMISFAPLQFNDCPSQHAACDKFIADQIGTSRGMSATDTNHCLYLPEHLLGHGIKSMLDVDVLATARELKMVLNGRRIDSYVGRTE